MSQLPITMARTSRAMSRPSVSFNVEAERPACAGSSKYKATSQWGSVSPISAATNGCFQSDRPFDDSCIPAGGVTLAVTLYVTLIRFTFLNPPPNTVGANVTRRYDGLNPGC